MMSKKEVTFWWSLTILLIVLGIFITMTDYAVYSAMAVTIEVVAIFIRACYLLFKDLFC